MPEKDLNKVLTWFKKSSPRNPYSQYCKLLNKISTTSKGQKIKNISQVKQEIKSIIENKIKPDIKHKINGRSRHQIEPRKFFGRSRNFDVKVQKKNPIWNPNEGSNKISSQGNDKSTTKAMDMENMGSNLETEITNKPDSTDDSSVMKTEDKEESSNKIIHLDSDEVTEHTFDTSTAAHTEHPTEETTIDGTTVDPHVYDDNSMEFVQFAKNDEDNIDDKINESEESGKANADSDSIESDEEENENSEGNEDTEDEYESDEYTTDDPDDVISDEDDVSNKKESEDISKKSSNSLGFRDPINTDDENSEVSDSKEVNVNEG